MFGTSYLVDNKCSKRLCSLDKNAVLLKQRHKICSAFREFALPHGDEFLKDCKNRFCCRMDSSSLTLDQFNRCILEIVEISNKLLDGWSLNEQKDFDNGKYISKKLLVTLGGQTISYEYHVVYSLSYSVPVICFNVWRSDGTMISMVDYWGLNENFEDSNLYNSLTQLDHPVLCRPFLTLHPCKTQEIIEPFLTTSKNPVISWLSIMGPFIHLKLLEDYFKCC